MPFAGLGTIIGLALDTSLTLNEIQITYLSCIPKLWGVMAKRRFHCLDAARGDIDREGG